MNYLPIENEPGFVKDRISNAILNTDLVALNEYKQKKKQLKTIQDLKNEINMLKEELVKIKNHLNIS
jgi:cell shape-determining protein MreC